MEGDLGPAVGRVAWKEGDLGPAVGRVAWKEGDPGPAVGRVAWKEGDPGPGGKEPDLPKKGNETTYYQQILSK